MTLATRSLIFAILLKARQGETIMSVKSEIKSALEELARKSPADQRFAIERLSRALVKLAKRLDEIDVGG
jgi:hypothetical protein